MDSPSQELERLAQRLRLRAGLVRESAADQVRAGERAHWVSAAGQAYRQVAARDGRDVEAAAERLEAAAAALARHAEVVRERIAAIARAEAAVRSWLGDRLRQAEAARELVTRTVTGELDAAVRQLAQDPWVGLPFDPRRLPGPGEAGWLDVHRMLAAGHG
jgi:plasmid stability protein